ncbi:MAG TPA: ROK family transcriptional regulator [Pyrinomonadaceae bacterium]|nr:ROK family transcriptional regulator [Pyrinomonadaceae bacterium]
MRRIDLRKVQAANPHTIRDINRQIVLNYVREREPISRATIARETALQRSTISEIIEVLTGEGLVEEIGEGESTGGRRPTLLRLRTVGAVAIGVNITPTNTTIATSDLAGVVLQQSAFPTDSVPERTINKIIEVIRQFSDQSSIEGVGVSIPGLVNPEAGNIVFVPYFKWRDVPIADAISKATGLPVTIDNDANAVALAELWFGRPEVRNARDFIFVLVADGIGTGIIFDGQVYRGERGAAGEFGHMIVGSNAPVPCSCGNDDCWEAFASERAAKARYQRMGGVSLRDFASLVDRSIAGERNAKSALTETARYLGIGISNLIVGFSPEVVVVGGAITRAWPLIENALTQKIERSVRRGLPSARILRSTLNGDPTLMGALSLVLTSKFAGAAAA